MPIFAAPLESVAAFGFIGLSVPIYFISNYVRYRQFNVYQHLPSFLVSKGKYSKIPVEMQDL